MGSSLSSFTPLLRSPSEIKDVEEKGAHFDQLWNQFYLAKEEKKQPEEMEKEFPIETDQDLIRDHLEIVYDRGFLNASERLVQWLYSPDVSDTDDLFDFKREIEILEEKLLALRNVSLALRKEVAENLKQKETCSDELVDQSDTEGSENITT